MMSVLPAADDRCDRTSLKATVLASPEHRPAARAGGKGVFVLPGYKTLGMLGRGGLDSSLYDGREWYCATLSAGTFWHGSKLDEWANAWTRYYTGGKGNYMVAAMEDSGTMQALTFLNHAGRVDLQRVLVLRTVSNYDREPPGTSVTDSLKEMVSGNYSAYMPSLEAAQIVGDKVVRNIVEHWNEREATIPSGR